MTNELNINKLQNLLNEKWKNTFSEQDKIEINNNKTENINTNPILNANLESKENKTNEINIDELKWLNKKVEKTKKIHLWKSWIWKKIKSKKLNYRKIFIISSIITTIFSFISILLKSYLKYIEISIQPTILPQNQEIIDKITQTENKINTILNKNTLKKYQNLVLLNNIWLKNLQNIITTKEIWYIHKKQILQNWLEKLTSNIFKEHWEINNIKQEISKYWYVQKEIYEITNKNSTNSIKKSLLSLEAVKFVSAIKVFSYLNTFTKNFSSVIWKNEEYVKNEMTKIFSQWENIIYLYLNNCYLNPYERDYSCNNIWDFNRYFNLFDKKNNIDIDFFKKLIKYIDFKLEQTEIPSFRIIFKQFNPNNNRLIFTIEVNTFPQDELSLLNNWIINPHIFIITQLVNFLKQSRFILWSNIEINDIKINKKNIKIWNNTFIIHNSKLNFDLPIQTETEREISDFINN